MAGHYSSIKEMAADRKGGTRVDNTQQDEHQRLLELRRMDNGEIGPWASGEPQPDDENVDDSLDK
jgi:hypothetical protein